MVPRFNLSREISHYGLWKGSDPSGCCDGVGVWKKGDTGDGVSSEDAVRVLEAHGIIKRETFVG